MHEFLTDKVMASEDPALAYHGRVAANVLGIVERELAHPPVVHPRINDGGDDWFALALDVRDRLAVANPKHLDLTT